MNRLGQALLIALLSGIWGCSSGGSGTTTTGGTTGGQCMVPTQVTSDLALSLECATWSVTSNVKVGSTSSPTLTVKAGVKVVFSPGTSIDVGDGQPGGLQILGTSASHVVFTSAASSPAPGDWGGIQISSLARSDTSFSFLDLSYAGASAGLAQQASIVVDATAGSGASVTPMMSSVTLTASKGHGFFFQGNHAGPGAGSGQLGVNGWDSAVTGHFYPFVIDPDSAGLLPGSVTVTPTTPATAVISLKNYHQNDVVDSTQTWAAMPVPFLLGLDGATGGLVIGSASSSATLTIAAPNTLQFANGYGITVNNDPTNGNMSGALVANGNNGSTITFTSAAPSPSAGDWSGFQFEFGSSGSADSSLTYCNIAYAGGSFHLNGDYGAMLLLGDAPVHICDLVGPTVANCTFTNVPAAQNCIVASQIDSSQTQGYKSQNTFPSGTNAVLAEVCN
jgi:hypothetical protein